MYDYYATPTSGQALEETSSDKQFCQFVIDDKRIEVAV
jgi:hypothetical protein